MTDDRARRESDQRTIAGLESQRAADQETIAGLEQQGVADRDTIAGLEQQGVADRDTIAEQDARSRIDLELIEHLRAEAVIDQDKIANLEIALASSRRIGTAIGILMAQHRITADAAFDTLVRASQDSRRKLRDVADVVVESGAVG